LFDRKRGVLTVIDSNNEDAMGLQVNRKEAAKIFWVIPQHGNIQDMNLSSDDSGNVDLDQGRGIPMEYENTMKYISPTSMDSGYVRMAQNTLQDKVAIAVAKEMSNRGYNIMEMVYEDKDGVRASYVDFRKLPHGKPYQVLINDDKMTALLREYGMVWDKNIHKANLTPADFEAPEQFASRFVNEIMPILVKRVKAQRKAQEGIHLPEIGDRGQRMPSQTFPGMTTERRERMPLPERTTPLRTESNMLILKETDDPISLMQQIEEYFAAINYKPVRIWWQNPKYHMTRGVYDYTEDDNPRLYGIQVDWHRFKRDEGYRDEVFDEMNNLLQQGRYPYLYQGARL